MSVIIVSTFEQTLEIEQALAVLEKTGVGRDSILVVPMDPYQDDRAKLALRAEEVKTRGFEVGMVLATVAGVIGASVGFVFKWGPIIWGLLYSIGGFIVGFGAVCLYRVMKGEKAIPRSPRRPFPELTVIVQCPRDLSEEVRHILWRYRAISVGYATDPLSYESAK